MVDSLDGQRTLLQNHNKYLTPYRAIAFYTSFVVDICLVVFGVATVGVLVFLGKHNKMTYFWACVLTGVTVLSLLGTLLPLRYGKDELDTVLGMGNDVIASVEVQNHCCMKSGDQSCACKDIEGESMRECTFFKGRQLCYNKPIECFDCKKESQFIFFIASLHNIVQYIVLVVLTIISWKRYMEDHTLGLSSTTESNEEKEE